MPVPEKIVKHIYRLIFLVVLSVLGAGQLKADALCVPGTLATYAASGFSCNVGGLDFSLFGGAVFPAGPGGTGPFTTSDVEITPVSGPGGTGLVITFPGGDQATATQVRDVELPFEVTCVGGSACLSSVLMSISGSATGTTAGGFTPGQDLLTETYCIGGVTPPPTAPCHGGSTTQDLLTITPTTSGTLSRTDTFSAVSQLNMSKDIQAMGNNGTATVTSVQDLFLVSTPEPSSILLLGIGLAGLALLSRRKLRATTK